MSAPGEAGSAARVRRWQSDDRLASLVAIGAVAGLAWAASLRAFMAQIVEPDSTVIWLGTFGWILAPGIATGALLGLAEHCRRTGGRPGWRWLALSPLLFASVLLPGLLDPASMFAGGVGGGAIGVPVYGILGGYAISGRGPVAGRLACGVLFASMVPLWAMTVTSFAGAALGVTTARGLWVALTYWSLMAVLALGCAIPYRPIVSPPSFGSH